MRKERIDIELLLPEVDSSRDSCVRRLSDLLESRAGIDSAHTLEREGDRPGQICIHYDPDLLSLGQVRELAGRVGAELDRRYGHWLIRTSPTHPHRASAIESRLSRIPGVVEAIMSPEGVLRVEYDRQKTNEAAIAAASASWLDSNAAIETEGRTEADASPKKGDHAECGHDHGGIFGKRTELVFACLCGVWLLIGWLIETLADWPIWVSRAALIAAYFFGGYFTLKEAGEKIRGGKFEIDFLMLVAAAGAASLGAWAEGALLLFLFSIGHALEGYAMGRAKQAIEALAELAPRNARVRRNGSEHEMPVEQVAVGDVVVIKPGERVPADGFVIAGQSSVDQSPITGESVPVDKTPVQDAAAARSEPDSVAREHRVFAGTINQAGALEIQVTKTAAENTLSRIVTMVNEAETRVSPTQQFTKKFERYFVPAVIGIVMLLLFAPFVVDEPFAKSFYRAMAVLVAASPCALAIATPSAVLSGVARAAQGGVLIKGGGPLESLGHVDSIAFDKTGTLTEGKPKLTDVRPAEGVSESELLRTAIAVETLSNHPLAQAIVRDGALRLEGLDAPPEPVPDAMNLQSIIGRGIQASVEGQTVYIGKDDLFAQLDGPVVPQRVRRIVESLEAAGRTTMIVRRDDQYLGVFGLMDTPREASKRTIQRLRELGIRRMVMISGDNQNVADAVADELGIDEARGDLMPEDKVAEIKKFNGQFGVAMVGDGVNDAPAMASASVGIAMGAAGSDVALETADVALMADDLDQLPLAIGLSRATSRIIRQNLWFSLGMVALLVPATIFGLSMGLAVMFHEGSTLIVVCNALRLLAYSVR